MKEKILFYDRKMGIPDANKREMITHYYGDLMYIMVDKPYCDLYFAGNFKYRVVITLKEMMEHLPKAGFMICKRSALVNLCYMKRFKKNPPMIVMNDDTIFNLSKQNKIELEEMMNSTPRISPPCTPCYTCTDNECESQVVFCRRKELRRQKEPQKE